MKMKYNASGQPYNSKERAGSSDTHYLVALAVIGRESPSDIAFQLDRTYQNIINICKSSSRSILFCMKMINPKSNEKENERLLQQFISRPIKDKKERELQYFGD